MRCSKRRPSDSCQSRCADATRAISRPDDTAAVYFDFQVVIVATNYTGRIVAQISSSGQLKYPASLHSNSRDPFVWPTKRSSHTIVLPAGMSVSTVPLSFAQLPTTRIVEEPPALYSAAWISFEVAGAQLRLSIRSTASSLFTGKHPLKLLIGVRARANSLVMILLSILFFLPSFSLIIYF